MTLTPYWRLVWVCLFGVGVVGCGEQFEPLPADRVCLDAAFAVSNRVHACTDDAQRATESFDRFQARTRCLVQDVGTEPIAAYYDCPTKILNAPCSQIEDIEADGGVAGYLALSDKCPLILQAQEEATP